jgi:hypothetical protein
LTCRIFHDDLSNHQSYSHKLAQILFRGHLLESMPLKECSGEYPSRSLKQIQLKKTVYPPH